MIYFISQYLNTPLNNKFPFFKLCYAAQEQKRENDNEESFKQ